MKKTLLIASIAALSFQTAKAQITIFEDSFEAYADFAYTTGNVGNWTLTDLDGKNSYVLNGSTFPNQGIPKAFIVFNRDGITPPSASDQTKARTGNRSMACFNVSTPAPLVNNDWLISPQMTLGASGNNVSFWVKSINALYGAEKFNVLVSTTNTNTSSFTKLNSNVIVTSSVTEWNENTFNLDAYAGQTVYIAIQCVSDDQFALFVDDFKVTAATLSVNNVSKDKLSLYPNPTSDYLNFNAKVSSVQIFDATGRKVTNINVDNNKVDVKNLEKGAYVIKFETEKGTQNEKFIKK